MGEARIREQRRLDKLNKLKVELIGMLEADEPSHVQKVILENLEKRISEKEAIIAITKDTDETSEFLDKNPIINTGAPYAASN